jgi:hypothetical protein
MRWLRASTLLASLVTACSPADGPAASADEDPCVDGTYLLAGEVNDEACRTFLAWESSGQIVTSASLGPKLTAPVGPVQRAVAPTFAWTKGALAHAAPSPWRRLLRALDPIPTAEAHGLINGDAAVLIFRDGQQREVYRVMTSGTEFTPDGATWQRVASSSALSLALVGVRFADNAVARGTRPTQGPPVALVIE